MAQDPVPSEQDRLFARLFLCSGEDGVSRTLTARRVGSTGARRWAAASAIAGVRQVGRWRRTASVGRPAQTTGSDKMRKVTPILRPGGPPAQPQLQSRPCGNSVRMSLCVGGHALPWALVRFGIRARRFPSAAMRPCSDGPRPIRIFWPSAQGRRAAPSRVWRPRGRSGPRVHGYCPRAWQSLPGSRLCALGLGGRRAPEESQTSVGSLPVALPRC